MTFAKRFVQLFLSFGALISPVFAEIAHPYHLDATMIPADGIGQLGEPVKLSCKLFKSGNLAVGEKLRIVTKWESNEISNKTIVFDGKPFEISYKSDKPGWVYFCIQVLDKDGKVIPAPGTQVKQLKKENILFEAGAMFAPDKIVAVPSMPKDFEEFWQQEKKALEALPMDVKLQKCKLTGDIAKQVQCFAVEINCLGRTPVTGYLAYPIDANRGN